MLSRENKIKSEFENEEGRKQIEFHLRWLNLSGISGVPIAFVNSSKIPSYYSSKEISKLITIFKTYEFAN